MKNKILILAAFTTLMLCNACSDPLKEVPYSLISPNNLGSTEADARLYVNGVLNTLHTGGFWAYGAFPKVLELDNDDITAQSWAMSDFGAGNFQPAWFADAMWQGPYIMINRCNVGIREVSKMDFNQEAKDNALGQLYFLKAWSYFLLVRAYGDVPIYKTDTPEEPRSPIVDVYDHIIENLKLAEETLYDKNDARFEKGRVNKWTASGFLAKVYLTMASGALTDGQVTVLGGPQTKIVNGKTVRILPVPITHSKTVVAGYESIDAAKYFQLAHDKAKEIMDNAGYTLFPTYADIWKIENRNTGELMWSLQCISGDPILAEGTTVDYYGYFAADKITVSNGGWYGVSDHWYQIFDAGDQRIEDGVSHRRKDGNGYWQYYPGSDSLVVKGTDMSPEADAKRAKYGYQPGDNYSADDGHICHLSKFAQVTDPTTQLQDFNYPFLRYAEVLLIYAEAENEINGGSNDAKAAVDLIRVRSSATPISSISMGKQELRSFILEERRRELGLEGNRRWDLIRWGIYLPVMNAIDIDANNVLKRRVEKQLLYPIPVSEINGNTQIDENNPGY